ncbi:hypothetical protein MSAN_02203000 [Mycena sanguinolenta]|uniref:Uncharacterized protein n=1 Tax=Mycena sanguinolenta TaxID=230812 RepID=A0A8H6XDM7_9AGAR|nr:hypothetical protein MSAN_02203000 [Mycena sanguinolenta]
MGSGFLLVVLSAVLGLFAPTVSAAAAPTNWKTAVGWNGTVLPSLGTSVGPFTAPGTSTAKASPAVAAAVAPVSDLGSPGGVFICQNTDWQGLCGYAVEPMNECILLASPWLNTISSFGPDPGATCFAFASGNCDNGEAKWSFTYPGDDSGGLATTDPFNDQITSFACVSS